MKRPVVKGILLSVAVCLAAAIPSHLSAEILAEELSGPWKIRVVDDPSAADPATEDALWSSVEVPGDLSGSVASASSRIWLRRTVHIDPAAGNYALYLGHPAGRIEVFANGTPAVPLPTSGDGPSIFVLPAMDHPGPTVLALRIEMRKGLPAGILRAPVRLMDVGGAVRLLFFEDLSSTVLALFYAGLALVLFWLNRRRAGADESRDNVHPANLDLIAIYGLAGLAGLLASPLIREELRFAEFLLPAATALSALIPAFFIRYLFRALDESPNNMSRMILPVAGVVGVAAFALRIFHLDRFAEGTIQAWYLALIPLWGFLVFRLFRRTARDMRPAGFALLAMFGYFLYAGGALLLAGEYFATGLSASRPFFAPAMLVPAGILVLTGWLQERNRNGVGHPRAIAERLAANLFHYIARGPANSFCPGGERIPSAANDARQRPRNSAARLKQTVDEILELCRLEALESPDALSALPVKGNLQSSLSGRNISTILNMNDDVLIETDTELLNRTMGRILDFRELAGFSHIDLIGRTDHQGVHLKFMLHQPDRTRLRQIQSIVSDGRLDGDGLWLPWRIIEESVRLLGGNLRARTLSGRYLSLDLALPAAGGFAAGGPVASSIPLVFLHEGESASPAAGRTGWRQRILRFFRKGIA